MKNLIYVILSWLGIASNLYYPWVANSKVTAGTPSLVYELNFRFGPSKTLLWSTAKYAQSIPYGRKY